MSDPNRDFYDALGRRIAQARGAIQMTQASLAQRVGMSRASITNVELGRQAVQVHVLVKIALALNVPIGQLVSAPVEEGGSYLNLNGMDHDKRAWIEGIIRE